MGLVSYRLAVCKDIVKKVGSVTWESLIWKGWFDNAVHDPLLCFGLILHSRLHCSLPEEQGLHDRLTESMKAKLLRHTLTGT